MFRCLQNKLFVFKGFTLLENHHSVSIILLNCSTAQFLYNNLSGNLNAILHFFAIRYFWCENIGQNKNSYKPTHSQQPQLNVGYLH